MVEIRRKAAGLFVSLIALSFSGAALDRGGIPTTVQLQMGCNHLGNRNYSPVECRLGGVLVSAGCGLCVVVRDHVAPPISRVHHLRTIVLSVSFLACYIDSRPFVKQLQVGLAQGAGNPCHTDSRSSVTQPQVGLVQGVGNPCHTDSRSLGKQSQVGVVQGA